MWLELGQNYRVVKLNITNRGTGVQVPCQTWARLDGNDVKYHIWATCFPRDGGAAEILWDAYRGNLGLRETWSCLDEKTNAT